MFTRKNPPMNFRTIDFLQFVKDDVFIINDIQGQIRMSLDSLGDPVGSRGETPFALGSVAMELDMGQVDGLPFRGVDGGEGGADVARNAEVARMHVQGMRHAQVCQGAAQPADHLPRRDPVAGIRFVNVEGALVEFEGIDATGIHNLDADALGGTQGPGHIVVHGSLLSTVGQHL